MSKIRVLIVDDSVVIRKILTDVLSEDPGIEVAGTAPNGRIALAKIPQVNPDLITLDIEMPEMDGLETLQHVRKDHPKLPVIMFSTLTQRGAETTLDALSYGASDYVTKPANVGKIQESFDTLRTELVPKIKALVQKDIPSIANAPVNLPFSTTKVGLQSDRQMYPSRPMPKERIDVVAIAISTGGPNALSVVIPSIPEDFPVPIVIVQHMPPVFTQNLAKRLDSKSEIQVVEGSEGDELKSGTAYIAPGGYHMVVVRRGTGLAVSLNEDPPENSCRPAADVLFRSVAGLYGKNMLGVVMTGMGYDGYLGCEVVRDVGGTIFAQDEESSVVWGMPGIVVGSGLADRVLSLEDIAPTITRRVVERRPADAMAGGKDVRS